MATGNPFDLLGDDDTGDVSKLIAIQQQKIVQQKATPATAAVEQPAPTGKAAKLPSKPPPPAQAVREAKTDGPRGGGRGGGGGGGRGYGRGRGGGGFDRDVANNDSSFNSRGFSGGQGGTGESDGGRQSERRAGYGGPRPFRVGGDRRGGFSNGETEDGERPRRTFERRSGTGRRNEFKREGAGRGNWGTQTDEFAQATEDVVVEGEKPVTDKPLAEEEVADVNKESPPNEAEEKEAEDKEMTLEEYQKVLEEKRKALEALKTEERKVVIDKELASMQPLSNKKNNDEVFAKLGSDKDKRKEIAEKDDRAKKSLSINEFLKPAEGERPYGGRGRGGRGRGGPRGGGGGGYNHGGYTSAAPSIEDPGQFPTLGGK